MGYLRVAKLKGLIGQIIIFLIGAIGYPCIELIYRSGNTHWTMIILGGIALLIIMNVNWFFNHLNIIIRASIATLFVTLMELVAGLIINKWLQMKVWDYSHSLFNIEGQICLKFSLYWYALCFAVIIVVELIYYVVRRIRKSRGNKVCKD